MSAKPNVLLLGGTTEASLLAGMLAQSGVDTVFSYAGRTKAPRPQPVPTRIGGFGGIAGLVAYLRGARVTHLVDATHPFAATMSANAVAAARLAGIPHAALTRPAWQAGHGDRWMHVPDVAAAVEALGGPPMRVMLALGRMHVDAFAARPEHHYLLRFVDVPQVPPPLRHFSLVVDRGPFHAAADGDLLRSHAIDLVVCKNAGGSGADAKLVAARRLGLPVLMIDRPVLPERRELHGPEEVLHWIGHETSCGIERGV